MPSKTVKQARTMRAAAHDSKFAKKVGIPQDVARDFTAADQGVGKRHATKTTRTGLGKRPK